MNDIIEQTVNETPVEEIVVAETLEQPKIEDVVPVEETAPVKEVVKIEPAARKTVKAKELAASKDNSLLGKYVVVANLLNVRNGAGTSKSVMVVIPKNTVVRNYGFHTIVNGNKWLYVQFSYDGVSYAGFCDAQYLKKK